MTSWPEDLDSTLDLIRRAQESEALSLAIQGEQYYIQSTEGYWPSELEALEAIQARKKRLEETKK